MTVRKNSFAFCGGAFGDEGKGRIIDEYVGRYVKKGQVVLYRDNGGAGAGHSVQFMDKGKVKRLALHQLLSGVFFKEATMVLGKGMVIHPRDLLLEMASVKEVSGKNMAATLIIDEMATLSLDTHRAFEAVLKEWQSGGKGATGRGISPAYADILLRHPLRMRDIVNFDTDAVTKHYQMYEGLIKGLGKKLAKVIVPTHAGGPKAVGGLEEFIAELRDQAKQLKKYTGDVTEFLRKTWKDPKYTYIFEKAQGLGLDVKWGVYPDVTASDTTFDGIFSATEGIIDPEKIGMRAGVIKATYMSSVGSRKLPSAMPEELAARIRDDANEYGATTKRPRDVVYLDVVALKFFAQVGKLTHLVATHMDIVYPGEPVKVCVGYEINGKPVEYRPDQEFLNKVKPVYKEFKPWDQAVIRKAKKAKDLPKEAQVFLKAVSKYVGLPIAEITTGPQRDQSVQL